MKKSLAIVLIVVVLAILGYAIYALMQGKVPESNDNQPPEQPPVTPENPPATGETKTVNMMEIAFIPNTITINKGDAIKWTNNDIFEHQLVSDTGSEIASEKLTKGASYTHTFNTAGEYKYHCSIHPGMKGTIIVQ